MKNEWVATYRLQLHAEFPLQAATKILPYLKNLGVSHVYLSPCLQATPGSRHGYDVVDPTRISNDLGGEEAWEQFHEQAKTHQLRILLDIVPNHMAVSSFNPWWIDVLKYGSYSQYASYFDISLRNKKKWRLHLALLEKPYRNILADSELNIELINQRPHLKYYKQTWPLTPASWGLLIGSENKRVFQELERLNQETCPTEDVRKTYFQYVTEAEQILETILSDETLESTFQNFSKDPQQMHTLLEQQFYVLHWWKLEGETVNYRRFFDIGSLIGIRMESDEVFEASHTRIANIITNDQIDGLRIDHPDGLRDPLQYFQRLRDLIPNGRIYLEKILDNDEALREEWPVEGTVGYEFLGKVNRLWMNEQKADALTAIYADFTKDSVNLSAIIREKKQQIIETSFFSDLEYVTDLAYQIALTGWQTRDLSRRQLREAIKQLTSILPIYRTYRGDHPIHPTDHRFLMEAIAAARINAPKIDSAIFDFIEEILTKNQLSEMERNFVARWQQLTPAIMAKGVEDTTFYCYDRLVSCNEVGAQASLIGISAEKFHEFCHYLSDHWPHNLLATSTHDNKRSEDVRTRISVLTEIVENWGETIHEWSKINTPAWKGRTPDRHAEYLFYQTLIGAWPIERDRSWSYMLKACREAKIITSWREPNLSYEESIQDFIDGAFENREFIESLKRFVEPLILPGRINSLAQALIKMTALGVPDFYQGAEIWDLSLVDPDNRRAVDFELRENLLSQCQTMTVEEITKDWESGLPKLWMIHRTMQIRQERPTSFSSHSSYQPVIARGSRLGHLFGFLRGEEMMVLVPRFTLTLKGDWGDTSISLPAGVWENQFTGVRLEGEISPSNVFGKFPVALLIKKTF